MNCLPFCSWQGGHTHGLDRHLRDHGQRARHMPNWTFQYRRKAAAELSEELCLASRLTFLRNGSHAFPVAPFSSNPRATKSVSRSLRYSCTVGSPPMVSSVLSHLDFSISRARTPDLFSRWRRTDACISFVRLASASVVMYYQHFYSGFD